MEPIPRALSQPVEAFPELHHQQTFFSVVRLEAWWFSHKHLLDVGIQESSFHVQLANLPVHLRGDREHHPHTLQAADWSESAAAV